MLVEIANSDIAWMQPRDLSLSDVTFNSDSDTRNRLGNRFGCYVFFADGSVRILENSLADTTLKALLTIDGKEVNFPTR